MITKEMAKELVEISKQKDELSKRETELRTMILEDMLEHNIDKCVVENVTFTQIIPKSKFEFNTNEFILNESEDVVKCFTTFEETEYFDAEEFIKENPEIYQKYLKKDVHPNVDTKKMEKSLTDVYKKYITEIPSDKPVSLRVNIK